MGKSLISRGNIGSSLRKDKTHGCKHTWPRVKAQISSRACNIFFQDKFKKMLYYYKAPTGWTDGKAGASVSFAIIRQVLNKHRLNGGTSKSTFLTFQNKRGLLEYARRHVDMSSEFWETILWTDVSTVDLLGQMDQGCVWREKAQAFDQKTTLPTPKAWSMMMWGCCRRWQSGLSSKTIIPSTPPNHDGSYQTSISRRLFVSTYQNNN